MALQNLRANPQRIHLILGTERVDTNPLEVFFEPGNSVLLLDRTANILHTFSNAAVLIPFPETTVLRIVLANGNYPDIMAGSPKPRTGMFLSQRHGTAIPLLISSDHLFLEVEVLNSRARRHNHLQS